MPILEPSAVAAVAPLAAARPRPLPSFAVYRQTRRRQSIDLLGHDAPHEYRVVASYCSGETLYTLLHVSIAWRAAALAELVAFEPYDVVGEERQRRVLWLLCTAREGAAGEAERRDNRAILARVLALTRAAKRIWVRTALADPDLVEAAAKVGDPQLMLTLTRDERLVMHLPLRVKLLRAACESNQPHMVGALLVGCPDNPPPIEVADLWAEALERALSGGAPPNAAQLRVVRWCNAAGYNDDLEVCCFNCERQHLSIAIGLSLASACLFTFIVVMCAAVILLYFLT